MPRPKVKDEDRKRVAKACDTCKRRKEKCDGGEPCLLCRRRDRESTCTYTLPRARRGLQGRHSVTESVRSNNSQSSTTPSSNVHLGPALAQASPDDAEIAIESLLTLSGSRSAPKTPADPSPSTNVASMAHAPVPKLARLLRDGHGKFIFVGDSSNLAFLQNIRRLARTTIGECSLTSDPMRHAMIEAIPQDVHSPRTSGAVIARPTQAEAEDYVNHYMLAASGAIDLFDKSDIVQHLSTWTEDNGSTNNATDSIFYLVVAIGARNKVVDKDDLAEAYFCRGRELAISSFMDDPSVLTVQSYVLIAFYLLTACRRNGAFMLLGIAVRAAYALGLHRSDISALFESRERRTRERVWKSLRVLDLFLSASLGRPPATSEVDGGNVSWEGKNRVYEDVRMSGSAMSSSALLRICFIFERILNEVYCRREVDVQLVNSISAQYRDWDMALDAGFDIDGLAAGKDTNSFQQVIGLAHLKCSYYWSIILLTRPFLIFDVSAKTSSNDSENNRGTAKQNNADTTTLSEACIDASLRSIEVASDIIHTPSCPKRPFIITNALFVSALIVGLAMFGDYDKSFPLMSSLEQAKVVLGKLAKHDPSGRRYFMITTYLQQAALEHIRRRDERQNQRRRKGIESIFGDLLHKESSFQQPASDKQGAPEIDGLPGDDVSVSNTQDMSLNSRLEDTSSRKGPTLTTSGTLAISKEPLMPIDPSAPDIGGLGDDFLKEWMPTDTDGFALPNYAEEFPLFSLMNDYTSDERYLPDLY